MRNRILSAMFGVAYYTFYAMCIVGGAMDWGRHE